MAWTHLIMAGALEILWAISLKYTDGFSKLWPSVLTISGMIASLYFLAQALKTIPVGTGYAIWTGIGAAGTAIWGMAKLGEPVTAARVVCLVMVIIGIIGLKLASPAA